VQISNAVYQQVVVEAPNGKATTKLVPAQKVVPGGEVVYQITYRNTGKQPATNVVINNPLPADLVYVETLGTPATAVSVDGGVHFGRLDQLAVIGPDGEPRAAKPADVTNLRWIVPNLAPGADGTVGFRAVVK
jgi:uncharacterized repeat protein (TIGR01451 family)